MTLLGLELSTSIHPFKDGLFRVIVEPLESSNRSEKCLMFLPTQEIFHSSRQFLEAIVNAYPKDYFGWKVENFNTLFKEQINIF